MELPDQIYDRIEELSDEGSDLFDDLKFSAAIEKWTSALDLLPPPLEDWEAFTWLSTSIGDARYQLGQFDAARNSLFDALNGPEGQGNPFVYYRLGQCLIRLGDEEKGIQNLLKAYMLDGDDIFSGEPDGQSYLQKLRDRGLVD